MVLHSRRLQSTKREERRGDADDLSWLMEVLNDGHVPRPGRAVVRRISHLLVQLRQIKEIRAKLRPYAKESNAPIGPTLGFGFRFDEPHLTALNLQGGEIMRDVNEALQRYRWSPTIMFLGVDLELLERPGFHESSEEDYLEKFSIWVLLMKFRQGLIGRMKQCDDCRRWFYALTDHQRFCKDSCRKHYASQSSEYRTKRRTYMRNYRNSQKVKDRTALGIAKRDKTTERKYRRRG
jgi:hypothetical protein